MEIWGCFSWPFNDIENAMNYEEGFSWCCSSWYFHEATEFKAHEKPMVISIDIERLIDHEKCSWLFNSGGTRERTTSYGRDRDMQMSHSLTRSRGTS